MSEIDAALSGAVIACYVEGSHADGTAIAVSDIDATVVVRDNGTKKSVLAFVERFSADAPTEFDLEVLGLDEISGGITPMLAWGSRLVHGEDIRRWAQPIPLDGWARERMHAAFYLLVTVFGRRPCFPIGYPDPHGPFFGYDNRTVRLPDGTVAPSTRNLIRVTGWIATALLAYRAGQYVARKRDCHALYRRHIGDEWSSLVEDVYVWCRGELDCLIPQDVASKTRLRALCERTLAFENHFARSRPRGSP